MVTAALPRNNAPKIGTRRQFDNVFFSGMALLILVTVFTGFARTYFLAGVFRAHLPNLLIHIHGAVFSSWILLLITQTGRHGHVLDPGLFRLSRPLQSLGP